MSQVLALNGDMTKRVVVDTNPMEWTASPSGTVMRKRLHLVGPPESGQVTSVVRYEPGASFPEHDHPEGEEIFVLAGVFSDQTGDYPSGSHLLNPEGFRHAPRSEPGCLLFVKLRQYDGPGRETRQLDTTALSWTATAEDGVDEKVLYREAGFPDITTLERWGAGTEIDRVCAGGCELFLIRGQFREEATQTNPAGKQRGSGTWVRIPAGERLVVKCETECEVYLKRDAVQALRTA